MEDTIATTEQLRLTLPLAAPARPQVPIDRGLRAGLRRFFLSASPMTWACVDALVIGLATFAAQTLLILSGGSYGWVANLWLATGSFCLSIVAAGLVFGLYERRTLLSRSAIVLRSVLTLALGVVLAFACLSVFFYAYASRWMGLSVCLTYLLVALPFRLLASELIASARVRVLCVGNGESIRKLAHLLTKTHPEHYEIVGHVRVLDGPERFVAARAPVKLSPRFWSEDELAFEEACPCLGDIQDIGDVLLTLGVDEIVVGLELTGHAGVNHAVAAGLEARCRVTDQATFVEKLLGEVPADHINAEWFLKADVQNHGGYEAIKRLLDIAAAAAGLLVLLPALPLLALVIRLDSRGPVFYRQIRVGQFGRCFNMYKFRTMRSDAEKDGAKWAQRNDSRVTRVGRFLRRTRFDELPQLFNILRGDMALVGPRPERPEFVRNLEQLLPHYRLRHLVKPGLSGWAQINYRYGASIADAHRKLCYDLYYLKHRSLDLDMGIVIRTAGTFLLGAR